jgi:adenylate kinase family enzyme
MRDRHGAPGYVPGTVPNSAPRVRRGTGRGRPERGHSGKGDNEHVGRRFSIAGISGSGKSTVGRAVAERLGLRYVELDALVHGPNWTEATDGELRTRIDEAINGTDGWVVDGNYRRKIGGHVLERADTLVWLDLPLRVCLARAGRRTLSRIRNREVLWNGNRETIRDTFLARDSLFAWAIRSHRANRTQIPEYRAANPHLNVVHLRSRREVEAWLSSL